MPACLLLLEGTSSAQEGLQELLQAARQHSCRRVYVTALGGPVAAVSSGLLEWLGALYAAVGDVDPRWEVVPCLPCAGWSPARLATLPDVQVLLAPAPLQQQAQDLLQQLSSGAGSPHTVQQAAGVAALQLVQLPATPPPLQQQQHGRQQPSEPQQQQQPVDSDCQQQQQQRHHGELQFANVAVGGTFDRLHAGHRLLLAATALVASHNVYAGITADSLLAKKANKHLLQDYDARRAAAVDFMALVRPGLTIAAGALTDPQEPTQAELDPSMQALVVSAETLPGGDAINAGRVARGFPPLQLVVVGLVGGQKDPAAKLSSSGLRQADAAAADAAAAAAAGAGTETAAGR